MLMDFAMKQKGEKMPRYIDADKLVGTFLGFSMPDPNADTMIRQSTVIRTIHEMPTADVRENVKGEWKVCDAKPPTWWYECSVCGNAGNKDYNYCPNCGAMMDERREDDKIH